jgi:hypothetical protein
MVMTGEPWELIAGVAGFIVLALLLILRGGKGG